MGLPQIDIGRWALNIASDGTLLPRGRGAFLPFCWGGVPANLQFAIWLYLAIEELPLAAEETIDPVRDMPRGILLALATLILSGFAIMVVNPALPGAGCFQPARSGEPVLEGFRALMHGVGADVLGLVARSGLIASFHAILFAQGRQIFALSRPGYLRRGLSQTNGARKTPIVAMLAGSGLGLAIMIGLRLTLAEAAGTVIGGVLLQMAVFGAMLSYIARASADLALQRDRRTLPRPFKSPVGRGGAWITIALSLLTLVCQVQDPTFLDGTVWVLVWLILGTGCFLLFARHRLVLSPEELAALSPQDQGGQWSRKVVILGKR